MYASNYFWLGMDDAGWQVVFRPHAVAGGGPAAPETAPLVRRCDWQGTRDRVRRRSHASVRQSCRNLASAWESSRGTADGAAAALERTARAITGRMPRWTTANFDGKAAETRCSCGKQPWLPGARLSRCHLCGATRCDACLEPALLMYMDGAGRARARVAVAGETLGGEQNTVLLPACDACLTSLEQLLRVRPARPASSNPRLADAVARACTAAGEADAAAVAGVAAYEELAAHATHSSLASVCDESALAPLLKHHADAAARLAALDGAVVALAALARCREGGVAATVARAAAQARATVLRLLRSRHRDARTLFTRSIDPAWAEQVCHRLDCDAIASCAVVLQQCALECIALDVPRAPTVLAKCIDAVDASVERLLPEQDSRDAHAAAAEALVRQRFATVALIPRAHSSLGRMRRVRQLVSQSARELRDRASIAAGAELIAALDAAALALSEPVAEPSALGDDTWEVLE